MESQMTSANILLHEHQAVLTVLARQDMAIAALERGVAVDPSIFADLEQFFSLFVGKCHHGKEEQLVFPVLRRSAALVSDIDKLEAEHIEGAALIEAYGAARKAYAEQGMAAAGELAAAARTYSDFLSNHIVVENERVLERASGITTANEEAALVAAFDRFEEDVMGKGTHERLHAMIDTLGPRLEAYA
jgi:hemerythrin-like domain-containing protein